MTNFVKCGMYLEDGIATDIFCDTHVGDCVIATAMRGNLLIDNLVVDNAEYADDSALRNTISHFHGIGAIITADRYIILHEDKAEIWDRFKPAKTPILVIEVNYDIEYDGEIRTAEGDLLC